MGKNSNNFTVCKTASLLITTGLSTWKDLEEIKCNMFVVTQVENDA